MVDIVLQEYILILISGCDVEKTTKWSKYVN